MNKINIDTKIDMIIKNREYIIKNVKKSLNANLKSTLVKIDDIIKSVPKENLKERNALLKAKRMIIEITDEILLARSVDDIKKVREKLNYYINKVKKELVKRNIDESLSKNYNESVGALRNDITEFTRCIKRRNNIELLNTLQRDDLSKEELQKILTSESKFNKRLMNKYMSSSKESVKETVKLSGIDKKELVIKVNDVTKDTKVGQDKKSDFEYDTEGIYPKQTKEVVEENTDTKKIIPFPTFHSKLYINAKMIKSSVNYKLSRTETYNNDLLHNCKNLIINIPRYIHNKRMLKLMKNDYATYYSGHDLYDLIKATEYNNSVSKAVSYIFSKTLLGRKMAIGSHQEEVYRKSIDELLEVAEEYQKHIKSSSSEEDISFSPINNDKKISLIK